MGEGGETINIIKRKLIGGISAIVRIQRREMKRCNVVRVHLIKKIFEDLKELRAQTGYLGKRCQGEGTARAKVLR